MMYQNHDTIKLNTNTYKDRM